MNSYPIVILPGWLLGSDRFKPMSRVFQSMGFDTFTVDFPGFAQGEPLTKVFTLTDYVKFVQKYLKQNRIDKAIFICHSFGGRVALKLLSQEPQKAVCMIISGTPGFPAKSLISRLIIRFAGFVGKIISYIPPFIFFRSILKRMFYRLSGSMDYYHTNGMLKDTFKNIINESLVEYMKKIRLPVLLLWGSQDKMVPVRIAKRMSKVFKNATLAICKDREHNFLYKEPHEFARNVMDFLQKNKV